MWIEHKYISMLAGTLTRLTRKGSGVWNFRCPFCGDSQKSKTKARGYLIQDRQKVYSMCHNCGESHKFDKFLQRVNPALYEQYRLEIFDGRTDIVEITEAEPKELQSDLILQLPRISLLDSNHSAVTFLNNRQIPTKFYSKLYYAEDFYRFCRNFFTDKYQSEYKEQSIVIPLINQQNKLIGFQGRSIDPKSKLRYITAQLSPANPKIYGLNTVDFNRTNYCLEGVFDAMFVRNSTAVLGVAIDNALRKAGLPTNRTVIVYDNEPRNKDVCKNINKAIQNQYNVVVWPTNIKTKDVNDLILNIKERQQINIEDAIDQVNDILVNHTYQGLEAEMMFKQWKKC